MSEREEEQPKQEADLEVLRAVLDGIDDVIYVADPESHELLFVNEACRRIWGEDLLGAKCHRALQGREAPCPFCTNDKIFGEQLGETHVWEFQNEVTGAWFRCSDKAIAWVDGRMVRFELASEISAQKRAEHALRERVKELSCMQRVSAIIDREGLSTAELLQQTAQVLSESWQHAESAVARVRLGEDVFASGDLAACIATQTAEIQVAGALTGEVTVGYTEHHPTAAEGPFLAEERQLIDAVAEMLGAAIGRQRAEAQLRVHHQELEAQVAERTAELERQKADLARLARELTTIIDSVPGLVFYKDAENRYVRVNQYVADAHKMTKEQLEGTDCFEIYPREQAQAYLDDDLAVIRSGAPKLNFEEPWVTEVGERWVSTSKIPYLDARGEAIGVIGVAMDITERKQAEQALEHRSRLTEATNRMLREALTCESEEQVAATALQLAEELTGSAFGFVGEINAEGRFDTIAISNPGWEACAIEGSQATTLIKGMELRGLWAMVLKSARSQIVDDPQAHPERVGTPKGHPPLTSFLGVPLLREGQAVGMIALANKDGAYTGDDREAVEALAAAFYEALLRKRLELAAREQALLESAQTALAEQMRGDLPLAALCERIVGYLCRWLEAPTGLLYVADDEGALQLVGSHAHRPKEGQPQRIRPGEGQLGQAARDRRAILIEEVDESYLAISSGLGEMLPRCVAIEPIVHDDRVRAVVELGMLRPPIPLQQRFLAAASASVASAIESARARETRAQLLEQAQQLAEELQAQQEELKASNEELEEQTQRLADSELRLKAQQEELQVANEELEEKNELLERRSREVDGARREIEKKAEDLAQASQYKSDFLANMSHELRTPLNSLLLLARSLADNAPGNLDAEQQESARVIYESGNDLLALINEILDLSKIEAGRMELHLDAVHVEDVMAALEAAFQPLAAEKGLALAVALAEGAPRRLTSDRQRLEQVLRNLVANAVKFTERGEVRVTFGRPDAGAALRRAKLDPARTLAVAVSDTGIGIPEPQQREIFDAFRQADGSAARRFGGTGLGLSIARELTALLGGELQLTSAPGEGSVFTLFVPLDGPGTAAAVTTADGAARGKPPAARRTRGEGGPPSKPAAPPIRDDREQLAEGDRALLIVEDDPRFAAILAGQARARGFKVLAASRGEEGIALARRFRPGGVLLDLKLPGIDGWRVLELLKGDPETRHIPVHVISAVEPSPRALRKGAIGYHQKPVSPQQVAEALKRLEETASRRQKRVLVVEDDDDARRAIVELVGDAEVEVDEATGGAEAIAALRARRYDCVILDLGLWDFDGDELLRRIERDEGIALPPVIVYTARDLSWQENLELRGYSDSIIIKDVRSDERLLDEVSLFLHRVVAEMPEQKRQLITDLHDTDALLRGKKVLLVDDDMRALFALTKILSERGMAVTKAENGARALEQLEQQPDVDVVLMDIMMPVLDGYETMRRIRAQERFARLPIIALTAKAMKGDQERCIAAGASDYLPKPVDRDRLVSMLRVWLYR